MRRVEIEAWDEVFVRCTRVHANGLVVDPATWPRWWPGVTVEPAGSAHDVVFTTPLRLPVRRHLRITVDRIRPRDKGVELSVAGDVEGTAEFFHLDEPHGVVVHHLLRGRVVRGNPRRWLAAHRASTRAGLTDLKRRLEAGRLPGAEPHPALLAHQAEELAVFAREVAKHREELAEAAREQAG